MKAQGASHRGLRKCLALFGLATLCLCGGCATQQMKGTPFYTGEYARREGPVEDRVNLWPLLYYRKPALSVLWPFIEATDDDFAIRPVYSVYGRADDREVYNFLWPLGQYDSVKKEGRFFPAFWGRDYRAVFPLYWHGGHPLQPEGGYDSLFPLWIYSQRAGGYNLHAPWPVFNIKRREHERGWRVWPLVGHYERYDSTYSFLGWPFGHAWSDVSERRGGSTLFPFYYHERAGDEATFLSLPYSKQTRKNGESWELALPLYYREQNAEGGTFATLLGGKRRVGDKTSWVVVPAAAWGHKQGDAEGSTWILGPLAHFGWNGAENSRHVLPFFYSRQAADNSLFVSPLWCSGTNSNGSAWQLVPPLLWHRSDAESDTLITPLYARGKDADSHWETAIPLYYRRQEGEARMFTTLLGGISRDADGRRWMVYPLLSTGRRTEDGGDLWVVAPLFHARWSPAGATHHLLPLYYYDGVRGILASPLAARWGDETARNLLIPPLLSFAQFHAGGGDAWLAAGLAKASWGSAAGAAYLFPFFYSDPRKDALITPLWARWNDAEGVRRTLSPLHYSNRESGTFASPLYATWRRDEKTYRMIPPTLSWWHKDGESRDTVLLLGLFRDRRGPHPEDRSGHLLPLYYHEGKDLVYTPLFGWDHKTEDRMTYPLTPLFGIRTGGHQGSWLFPLYSWKRDVDSGQLDVNYLWGGYHALSDNAESGLFPLFSYKRRGTSETAQRASPAIGRYGKRFWCLPICWYRNEQTVRPDWAASKATAERSVVRQTDKRHGVFPLWSYRRSETPASGQAEEDGSLLLALYDHHRALTPPAEGAEEPDEYVRKRILWRLWHYERSNGDVSVDIFPAIAYDRREDGFKKIAFLWRMFRYERGPVGKKLDLLFLPLMRRGAK